MSAARRLEKRKANLDAHVVPVERALLEMADRYAEAAGTQEADVREIVASALADHCRKFAEELHWVR